jgi:hypothetical protein
MRATVSTRNTLLCDSDRPPHCYAFLEVFSGSTKTFASRGGGRRGTCLRSAMEDDLTPWQTWGAKAR